MKKFGTRVIGAVLAACMMASVLPVSAFASGGGTDEETGESAGTVLNSGEYADIYESGIYTLKEGTYTGDNAIYVGDLSGEVTINVTGDIKVESDGPFLNIYRDEYADESSEALKLTINLNGHTISSTGSCILVINSDVEEKATATVNGGTFRGYGSPVFCAQGGTLNLNNVTVEGEEKGSVGAITAVSCEEKGTVHIDGGSYYGQSNGEKNPTLANKGTMTVANATVHSEGGHAVCNEKGEMTLSGGELTSAGAPTVYTGNGTKTTIEKGTYQCTDENPAISSNGELHFNGGTVSAPNHSAIVCNGGTAEINGGTIKDSKKGIAVQGTAADVVLNNAVFENNSSDIYLAADQSITVKDTFKDRATVKAENASYEIKGDPNANLVSQNEGSYWAYDENKKNYILKQPDEGMYFVDAVNATATADHKKLKANTPVSQNDTVTLTADTPEDGMEFAGWELTGLNETDLIPDENDPLTFTFTMPDADVTVEATYRPKTPDDGGSTDSEGSAGKVIATVVIGAAATWGVYEAGTGIYRMVNMNGIPLPANRGELAKLLWQQAGKPEPQSAALYADIDAEDTALQKAARWCTEQGLLGEKADNIFKPGIYVTKLRVCAAWEKAKQRSLLG